MHGFARIVQQLAHHEQGIGRAGLLGVRHLPSTRREDELSITLSAEPSQEKLNTTKRLTKHGAENG